MFNANNNFKCINVDFNTTLKGGGGGVGVDLFRTVLLIVRLINLD